MKASKGEPELISWDDVDAQKDVYEAITTSDGRQALVKAAPGAALAGLRHSPLPLFSPFKPIADQQVTVHACKAGVIELISVRVSKAILSARQV